MEQLVSFEIAKLAKEKGFKEKCFRQYFDTGTMTVCSNKQEVVFGTCEELGYGDKDKFLAPTQSLLQKWLRENKDIHIIIGSSNIKGYNFCFSSEKGLTGFSTNTFPFETYEEALEKALFEALSFV